MEDEVLELLNNSNKSLDLYEIKNQLNIENIDDIKELVKTLNKLEEDLKICYTKKNKYLILKNSNLRVGNLQVTKKGFGFVDIDGEEDVYIALDNMNGAIHGDQVVVEITSKKSMDLEGRIVRVVKRQLKNLVGTIRVKNNKYYVDLDDDKIKLNIILDKNSTRNLVDGHKVVIKVLTKINNIDYNGEVIKILGHINDPGVDILSIVAKHDINDTFNDDVIKEIDKIPDHVLENEYKGRTDLRDEVIFTIDGDDTKDIDDAISIDKLSNGNYKLGVHIADVSYYVKEGSSLDREAYDRGTSVYLADRVIPMLPHKLSNGICSLNPNVDRLAMSCVMEIDNTGEVVDYEIFESVVKSRIQMTYKKVNSILEDGIVPSGYEEYVDKLKIMRELADILRKNKIRKGYIDFDLDEAKIIVNENGEAIDVTLRNRGTGEKLIEDFMIAANETVARHIYYMDYPFVYRVHGEPSEEKISRFLRLVSILGYQVNGKYTNITPKNMQKLLDQLKDKKEFKILSSELLKSMQKAVYDYKNIGHFGLASKCYTHFTSPIRRYPDTTVHRLLRAYLFNDNFNNEVISHWEKKLPALVEHASYKERCAVECEREVDDMKMAEYMEKHIGEEFEGIISSVLSFGMFVELPNLIEGLIRFEDLNDDFYIYDESTFSIKGQTNHKIYRLGDNIRVKVKSASKEKHTIDFIIANEKNNS